MFENVEKGFWNSFSKILLLKIKKENRQKRIFVVFFEWTNFFHLTSKKIALKIVSMKIFEWTIFLEPWFWCWWFNESPTTTKFSPLEWQLHVFWYMMKQTKDIFETWKYQQNNTFYQKSFNLWQPSLFLPILQWFNHHFLWKKFFGNFYKSSFFQ